MFDDRAALRGESTGRKLAAGGAKAKARGWRQEWAEAAVAAGGVGPRTA